MGTDYHLRVWLVNLQADGKVGLYPFQLFCSFQGRWSTREIVCEENYMEQESRRADMAVMFQRGNQTGENVVVLSLAEAAALHFHISLSDSRLILRCPYSSPFSYFMKVSGMDLEVVSATVLYRLQSVLLAVDTTVACAQNKATTDGPDLLWTVPFVLSPLIHGKFRDRGMWVGVNGKALADSEIKKRRYKIRLQEGQVEVRIPTGAPGGHIKSGVVRGQYVQSMSVDLFFMSQWGDDRWPLTQYRSLRMLKTPAIRQTLILTKNTVPSGEVISVTLGPFASDVHLKKVTIDGGGDLLTWTPGRQTQTDTDLAVSRLSHINGSFSYQLSFLLSHPKIIPKYIGAGYVTYSLTFTFTLNISPNEEEFYHRVTIEHTPRSPRLEGKCTESSVLVLLYHGANGDQGELQWELFLGARKLEWDLVGMVDFVVEAQEDYLTVEIPLYSAGMKYEELTLQGLVAGVEVSVVEAESLKVQDTLVHKCTFPARELLVCSPEGRMVVVVDTTHTVPPTHPNQTALLDPSCVPTETDSARALFSFSVDSCGTVAEGNFLVYENQISYNQNFLPLDDPVIHRDSPYRLTIRCRYPSNGTSILSIQHPVYSSLDLSPTMPVQRTRRDDANTGMCAETLILLQISLNYVCMHNTLYEYKHNHTTHQTPREKSLVALIMSNSRSRSCIVSILGHLHWFSGIHAPRHFALIADEQHMWLYWLLRQEYKSWQGGPKAHGAGVTIGQSRGS
uniref:ZP domain-containing protein n=1 Tax=Echeneis naucrates TaxID=173247 RepID=A0A665VA21_ECHNA